MLGPEVWRAAQPLHTHADPPRGGTGKADNGLLVEWPIEVPPIITGSGLRHPEDSLIPVTSRQVRPRASGADRLGGLPNANWSWLATCSAAEPCSLVGGSVRGCRPLAQGVVQHADCVLEGSDFGPTVHYREHNFTTAYGSGGGKYRCCVNIRL